MAVDFDVKGSRTSEYRFLPQQIGIDPHLNGRHDLPDIGWLIDSILQMEATGGCGQIQPVPIRRVGGRPVLAAGFSRYRAIAAINKDMLLWVDGKAVKGAREKPLEVRCCYTALNEQQAFLANIEENRVRNATTPMDDAYNLQRLVNVYQMSEQECANVYRESPSWVRGRLALIEATPAAERAIRDGRVKGPAVKAIAKLKREQAALLPKEGRITVADIKKAAGEDPKPKPAKKAPPQPEQKDALKVGDELVALILGSTKPKWEDVVDLAQSYEIIRKS